MSGSVELATILLTDLVGSTRLATAVGPVRADQLRDEHFAVLREAIRGHRRAGGQDTGDGLMVAFGSTSAAVRCAVSMQQLFERRYRKAEKQLHIRIGLAAGESTVQDGDYFGMPSIEAARLCDKAPSDGILVSSLVKALAGRVEGVAFESVGELELKGFTEPMEAFAVPWLVLEEEGEPLGAWPLPAVLRSVPVLAYVGREYERAVIERAQSDASRGVRQVVLLSGEPGIGKSGWRLTSRRQPMVMVAWSLGGRVRRICACRMSRGSRCARSSSSALARPTYCTDMYPDMAVSCRGWRASWLGGCLSLPHCRAPIRRPSDSCCSRPWRDC